MASKLLSDIGERLFKSAKTAKKEKVIPQFRGSDEAYDPSYSSNYVHRPATFTSSDPEFALGFALSRRENQPTYFHNFPDLQESEVFDVLNINALKKHLESNKAATQQLRDARVSLGKLASEGHWQDVEALASTGFFDNLPPQYKAIRLRGEADNYIYIGRRQPVEEAVERIELPARKHYVGFLAEVDHALRTSEDLYVSPKKIAQLRASWNEIADDMPETMIDKMDILLGKLRNMPAHQISPNITSSDSTYSEVMLQVLNSVGTKDEARDLLSKLIVEPRVKAGLSPMPTPSYNADRPKSHLPKLQEVSKLLDEAPDEGFNMKDFIEEHKLYSFILPALGLTAGLDDEVEIRQALEQFK